MLVRLPDPVSALSWIIAAPEKGPDDGAAISIWLLADGVDGACVYCGVAVWTVPEKITVRLPVPEVLSL